MDVIGQNDLPTTETKASSAKLSNGSASLSEDSTTATATLASGGAGRKKAKRKSKAKNSQREDAESELNLEAPLARETTAAAENHNTVTVAALPNSAAAASDDAGTREQQLVNGANVNSNGSSSNSNNNNSSTSSHSNGLSADDSLASSVDAISKKLEQCVQISRNGLTNGLPNRGGNKSVDASPTEEGKAAALDSSSRNSNSSSSSSIITKANEPSTAVGKVAKKKQRSKQAKKAQTTETNTHCTVNGDDDGAAIEEDELKSGQTLAGRTEAKATVVRSGGSSQLSKGGTNEAAPTTCLDSSAPSNASTSASASAESKAKGEGPVVPGPAESQEPPQPPSPSTPAVQITYQVYESERQMPAIMSLIQKDLSEPYSIYTYRYFIHNWPKLCFLALHEDTCVGAIVCKLDIHRQDTRRGYIAMLAVDKDYRKLKIGTTLVQKAIQVMLEDNADEVVLETEITNQPALRLYENLGFVRDKRLFHYYLNGVDALRLKLWFR